MSWIRRIAFVCVLTCCTSAIGATNGRSLSPTQVEKINQIQALVEDQRLDQRVPGVSVALFDQTGITYAEGFGRADRAGTPMSADTPSALGSLTKSFTAVAVMQLVEEGRVDLDAHIDVYLPELGTPTDLRVSSIRVRQLLNHTSGYSTYIGNIGQADFSNLPDALDKAVVRLARTALATQPGEQFQYSNANYQILGLLIERNDHLSFEDALQKRILDRLAMTNSFVLAPSAAQTAVGPKAAEPFRFWLNMPIYFAQPSARVAVAQGGVYTSANDLARYLIDLASEAPKLLSVASRDALFEIGARSEGYGLGWFVEKDSEQTLVYHGGSNPGFETEAGFVIDQRRGFVVLTNAGSGFLFGNVANITDGVKNSFLSRAGVGENSVLTNRVMALVLALCCLVICFGATRSVLALFGLGRAPVVKLGSPRDWLVRLLLPSGVLLILATVFYHYLPKSFGAPLDSARVFAPDMGWLLTITACAAAVWALVRMLVLLDHQRKAN